ncbi:MAG: radical SAM protein [Clostridia bacterium]|nr:radical SAM protein [Clostridia bacterium]
MKKKVYFTQVGFDFGGSVYLPYAVGTMAAYALAQEDLAAAYEFPAFIFRREKVDAVLKTIRDPYIAAFSCSVWNMEFNKTIAARIKAIYPDCIVIFGGHSVRENSPQLLEEEPYIDLLMYGEGEQTFVNLLRALPSGDLSSVPNIAFRRQGEVAITPRAYYYDLSLFPSPYCGGVFDSLMAANPGTDFLAVLETNRGCPYSCAYCDWCAGHRVRHFPMEKVLGEIRWLAEHRVEYIFCGDSNFGMFDRDVEIARALVATKRQYGYPKVFRPCYEKNSADRVFEICRILNSEGMDKGATMAYQTLSPEALKNIGRKNLTLEHFSDLVRRYTEAGIPCYSELILGLPGETKESFSRGICRLLESGQHNSLSVYHCEMLPNSDMSDPEFIKKHGIQVIRVPFNHIHSAINRSEEVQEYSYLVRATNTMSREDWVGANLFSVCVQCFHSLGLLRCFSMYLATEGAAAYYDFFTGLLRYLMTSKGRLGGLWRSFREKYESSLFGDWNYHREAFGNVTWFFEEGAFLEAVHDYDLCMEELLPFLRRFPIGARLFDEMLRYQKTLLRKPGDREGSIDFSFDFYTYYEAVADRRPVPLEEKPVRMRLKPKTVYDDISDYAREVVWYGRRRGATVYHGAELLPERP